MPDRVCTTCKQNKSANQFGRVKSRCIDCDKIIKSERNKRWYENNREREIQKRLIYAKQNRSDCSRRHREYRERLRIECYNILGNVCICGETDQNVFQIDHINDDGGEDRRELAPHQLLLKVQDCPERHQILCANCNWRKRQSWLQRSEPVTKLRNKAIEKYGGCCFECSINDYEVLQFDHVDNDGVNNFRNRVMKKRYNSYIKEDHNVQLLCRNCHQRKSLELLKV